MWKASHRSWQRAVAWLVAVTAVGVIATGCRRPRKAPVRPSPGWEDLRLGDAEQPALKRVERRGWKLACKPATSLLYVQGNALHNVWVKDAAKHRTNTCSATFNPADRDAPKPRDRHVKLFFVDGRLVRMNVLSYASDADYEKHLTTTYGKFSQQSLALYAFAKAEPGQTQVWVRDLAEVKILWFRKAKIQEIVLLQSSRSVTERLRQITATRRGE